MFQGYFRSSGAIAGTRNLPYFSRLLVPAPLVGACCPKCCEYMCSQGCRVPTPNWVRQKEAQEGANKNRHNSRKCCVQCLAKSTNLSHVQSSRYGKCALVITRVTHPLDFHADICHYNHAGTACTGPAPNFRCVVRYLDYKN